MEREGGETEDPWAAAAAAAHAMAMAAQTLARAGLEICVGIALPEHWHDKVGR